MKYVLLSLSVVLASGLLLTNVYTSIVDAKSWGADIPNSIAAAREYYKVVNPGNFFRIFSPVNQVLAVLMMIIFWRAGIEIRILFSAALLLYVAAEIFTFQYFYPRNAILFSSPLDDVEALRKAWSEWNFMNWVRSAVIALGIISEVIAARFVFVTGKLGV